MKMSVGRSGSAASAALEPGQPLLAERATVLSFDQRIERDQAHRVILDRVVQEAGLRKVPVIGKRLDQCLATVVVSGDQVEGCIQSSEPLAQHRVGLGLPVVRKVARHQHHVDRCGEAVQPGDGGLELRAGVDQIRELPALGKQVGVGDLRDDHLLS